MSVRVVKAAGPRVLRAAVVGGLAAVILSSCGSLTIRTRCALGHSPGSEAYEQCLRDEQREADRLRERSQRQYPVQTLPPR